MSSSATPQSRDGVHAPVVSTRRPGLILAVVLLAVFVINLDATIVNVALPALSRQLHATTTELQWIVDAYNLTFAALILTGGTIGDRYGRRGTLAGGLAVFTVANAAAALATSSGALIALRVVMGGAAAFIFPTTLSIISQTFPHRSDRARAIGAWGATTGAAVALGPIAGGALLAQFSWASIFLAMVPIAALGVIGTLLIIPADQPRTATSLDVRGLAVAAVALGSLVYTIIQAPEAGWGSARTLAGFAIAAAAFAGLLVVERRARHPMLDVRLFANLRFTAASGAVTIAFFALFGFSFLIIQYLQIMRGYSALGAGVRILPVAVSLAVSAGIGPGLAVRIGNKAVVASGLAVLAAGFFWVSFQTATTPYVLIIGQMLLLGLGLGLSTAPATESIMGVLAPEQAGAGSAVNDASRMIGGTLGVAIIGSVYTSLYRSSIAQTAVPAAARHAAQASYAAGQQTAAHLSGHLGALLEARVNTGFLDGLHAGCLVGAGVCLLGVPIVLALLPARPGAAPLPASV
jgi:EmrB/QacA subfamily drug resistance transporter